MIKWSASHLERRMRAAIGSGVAQRRTFWVIKSIFTPNQSSPSNLNLSCKLITAFQLKQLNKFDSSALLYEWSAVPDGRGSERWRVPDREISQPWLSPCSRPAPATAHLHSSTTFCPEKKKRQTKQTNTGALACMHKRRRAASLGAFVLTGGCGSLWLSNCQCHCFPR